ncbi:hypothetical protein OQJ18_09200 [Fluoribacter dumoffii]|uniref:Dot/Icm secretion system substrate n=1 Tax=Fluoribacter dumoffii TaxID=463 RepID=A0A377G745_9GAMM|nr:hypothetical protein [Fluoribacter dumoffii]KTC89465.1 Dot/Icm secretion system substrate [Fluoribacter dumoffii NY 23]MCW8386739.1 hypothetical protein [Fluoribacter dumoffii]MCW8417726.1 hypothetical protein [Fluoribacter dumoffii]MCW8454432.1 hypothetical protein [Fluoribacter dumoffii]MCW8461494.1 hypothetical protein [Fluoribacter dumoffii]
MATSSNEFAALVNQLHKSPNDPVLKQAIVQHLPKMMALAQDNPLALYHLAHIYPPTSSQYQQTMRQSANLGCTNAMLVMMHILGKANDVNDLKKAVHYLTMINKSNDSYIKEQAKALLDEYPQLAKVANEQAKTHISYGLAHRFFTPQREKEESMELQHAVACNA